MQKVFKVLAPRDNPHICHIPVDRKPKIAVLKAKTGKSLYRIICLSAGVELKEHEDIQKLKKTLRKLGYKTIGDWATELVDILYEKAENLTPETDIPCVLVSTEEEKENGICD
jgi:hypothetical protein